MNRTNQAAFTAVDLIVLVAVAGVFALTLLPVIADSRPGTLSSQCQNGLRQLHNAWLMYAADHNDSIIYNLGVSDTQQEIVSMTYRNWANNNMNWSSDPAIVNPELLKRGPMFPYGPSTAIYKCPSDTYLNSAVQTSSKPRTRSYAMNAFFGKRSIYTESSSNNFFPSYKQWLRTTQVPRPASNWVFIEEHPDSINDGCLLNYPAGTAGAWGDLPGSLHNGAANIAFPDGHVDSHKWLSRTTQLPVVFSYNPPPFDPAGKQDFEWLMSRAAVLAD